MYILCNSNSNTPLVCLININISLPISLSKVFNLVVINEKALLILSILTNLNNLRIFILLIDLIILVLNDIQEKILSKGIVDTKSKTKLDLSYLLIILKLSNINLPSSS